MCTRVFFTVYEFGESRIPIADSSPRGAGFLDRVPLEASGGALGCLERIPGRESRWGGELGQRVSISKSFSVPLSTVVVP